MEKPLPVPPFQFPVSSIGRQAWGYDREETNHVFASLATSYEQLWHERESLLERVAALESEVTRVRDEPGVRDALASRVAELEAELERMREEEPILREVLIEAHRVARTTVDDARNEADEILAQARADAESRLGDVRAQQEEALSTLAAERQLAEQELETIRSVTRSTQSELSSFLRDAIDRARLNGDSTHAGHESHWLQD